MFCIDSLFIGRCPTQNAASIHWTKRFGERCVFVLGRFVLAVVCSLGGGCSTPAKNPDPSGGHARVQPKVEQAVVPELASDRVHPSPSRGPDAGTQLLPEASLAKTDGSVEPVAKGKASLQEGSKGQPTLVAQATEPAPAAKSRYIKVVLTKGKRKAIGTSGMTIEISRIGHKHRLPDGKPVGILECLLRYQGRRIELRWLLDPGQESTPWEALEGYLPYSEKLGRRPRKRVPGWRVRIASVRIRRSSYDKVYVLEFRKPKEKPD